ncbi:MAG TPA: ATP-binding cassette domain-containing protein [Solirubrobacteraceae bacterium]
MEAILLQVLLALGSGALIAGLAVGVVLIYRGSGIINLAIGGYAMLAGYAFWALGTGQLGFTISKWPALVMVLLFVMAVAALAEVIIFQPLRNSPPLAKLVASLGLLLTMQASMLLAFGTLPQSEPQVLTQSTVEVFGAAVGINRFIIAGIVIVATAILAASYRWTRFGLATRAASENEVWGMLRGLSPRRLAMANAVIAALLAGIVGIVAASITELDTNTLPLQIIPALAAAVLAGLSSIVVASATGFGIGVLYGLVSYASSRSWFPTSGGIAIPGVTDLIAFLLVVMAMFVRGAKLPGRGQLIEQGLPEVPKPKHLVGIAAPLTLVAAVALVVLPFDFRQAEVNSIIGVVMALSLVVITGFVGQISVVQLSLAGVAGFVISRLAHNLGVPFPVAPLAGVVGAVLLGLLTAASALRVRGVSLVIVTLAAAQAIENFYFGNTSFGQGVNGSPVPEPHIFGIDIGTNAPFRGLDGNIPSPVFGWFALATALLLCLMVGYMRRGGFGRRMLAVRSNERASAAAAINPRNVKLIAFGVSALIAGCAGSLYAYNFGSVSSGQFDAFTALSLIAFAYAGGITMISGAVFAGLISTQALFPYALDKWFGLSGNWFLLFGGVILIITLLQNPEGVMGAIYKKRHRRQPVVPPKGEGAAATEDRKAAAVEDGGAPAPVRREPRPPRPVGPPVLATEGLSVDFHGVHALRDVSLEIGEGELVGLIGPNGAGKTTFVDAVTGFVGSRGRVTLDGRDLRGHPPHARAALGLARTWQGGDLFDDLLVEENLAVAQDRSPAWRIAFRDRADRQAIENALGLFELGWAAKASPADLSQGYRKLVGVARALAAKPRLLLLDEPAAGLDTTESQALGAHLRAIADRGQSTLLIDHDMGLVLSICDRVVVLEFGELIADGAPEVVRRDPRVVAAYLGGAEVELAATAPRIEAPAPEEALGG